MSIIGEVLPPEVLKFVYDPAIGVEHAYRCGACHGIWKTIEVPIFERWPGKAADCCPIHFGTHGAVKVATTCRQIDGGRSHGPAINAARSMGAVYRRRECPVFTCFDDGTRLEQRRGRRRTRWTTLEVLATGKVCNDIRECPRCVGGWGAALRGYQLMHALKLLAKVAS